MTGPYNTRGEAAADSAHVRDAAGFVGGRDLMAQIHEGLLLAELKRTGVQLGDYDRLIAGWLATWEPELVQVILGWIERAHAAGGGLS